MGAGGWCKAVEGELEEICVRQTSFSRMNRRFLIRLRHNAVNRSGMFWSETCFAIRVIVSASISTFLIILRRRLGTYTPSFDFLASSMLSCHPYSYLQPVIAALQNLDMTSLSTQWPQPKPLLSWNRSASTSNPDATIRTKDP